VENARERGFLRIGRFVVRVGGFCEVGGGIVLLCVVLYYIGGWRVGGGMITIYISRFPLYYEVL